MKNTFIQKILFLLVLFFSSVVLSHGTVIISNVEHDKGYIDIKIYDSKESFLKEDEAVEAVRKKVNKGEVVVPLTKIHEGRIAIVVYHDEDGDGKLKTPIQLAFHEDSVFVADPGNLKIEKYKEL